MIKSKKNAGFFVRFGALVCDVVLFCAISISLSLICIGEVQFTNNSGQTILINVVANVGFYYLWLFLVALCLSIQFICIPLFFQGKTIGMIIFGIEVLSLDNEGTRKKWFKRNNLGGLLWIILIFMFMAFVSPKIINKMVYYSRWLTNEKLYDGLNYKLSNIETMLITLPSTFSTILLFGQFFVFFTCGINSQKIGLLDRLTNSRIVYKNKFIIEKIRKISEIPKPKKNDLVSVVWKE